MRSLRPLPALVLAGCYTAAPIDEPPPPGVIYTYPADHQRDVPVGARLLISFSDAIADDAAPGCAVVGPGGAVAIAASVTGEGKTLAITSRELEPGTTYAVHLGGAEGGAPLLEFTTRSDRPLAGPPSLVALNGSDPAAPGSFRPVLETSTLQLVFSEPLDPRSVALEPGAIELVDPATGAAVAATLVARGIHVALDPAAALIANTTYELRLGDRLRDLSGEPVAPVAFAFTPVDSVGRGPIRQTFRTREAGDPNAAIARTDAVNVMQVEHPLIGAVTGAMRPSVLETELGDPRAQDGPIAFRIPAGQRLASAPLDIRLAGAVASGLTTGDVWIELVTDGSGRLYRNPHRAPDTIPDNTHAPLLVDLSLDLAVYASDPAGNGVLAQTILGVQLGGLAVMDHGALAIETLGTLDIGLLGISSAPTHIVLDLISAPGATGRADTQPPALLASLPAAGSRDWVTDQGLELVFDEPIAIDRARAGGIALVDAAGGAVASVLELHGSVVVVRPRDPLLGDHAYRVELTGVADRAGNVMASHGFEVGTQATVATAVPASVVAVHPGAPCALVDADPAAAGRCAGGAPGDDRYRPFALAANERITVRFDQPLLASSVALGAACDAGSVRVERVDEAGACVEPVAGALVGRGRELAFVPAHAWLPGERYRLRVVSGPDGTCAPGELCGANGRPANFDPLAGTGPAGSGGPDLVASFTGAAATTATTLAVSTSPYADLNGSGHVDEGEPHREDNRVALRIAGTSGLIQQASFAGPDCVPETPETEACMYVLGTIPAQLGERRDGCVLPGGETVGSCVPVAMTAQAMYSTSVAMRAGALGILLDTETGMSVLRVREPADGPLEGYIVERDGGPVMVVSLELYLDAPDMSLPLAQHDLHSRPLAVALEGPVTFLDDGRIALTLRNVAEVPITVGIAAPLGITGAVELVIPAGEMKLRLVSPAQRGRLP